MAVTKTANQCPAIAEAGATVYIGNAGQDPPTSLKFSQGESSGVSTKLNKNSKLVDMAARYGAGAYAIGTGLALASVSGLTFSIANGQAVMDGIVEVYNLANQTATANSDNWVWLKQNGTIQIQVNTTAKPTGNCVLLGLVVAGASSITSVGTDGAPFFRSGQLWRETNDVNRPSDTPASSLRLITKTQNGEWLWNGTHYVQVGTQRATTATTDATQTTLATIPTDASMTTVIEGIVTARRTGGSSGSAQDGAAYKVLAVLKNTAGTAAVIGSVVTVIGESQGGWDVAVDTSSGSARIRVTGAADNNINWRADWSIQAHS